MIDAGLVFEVRPTICLITPGRLTDEGFSDESVSLVDKLSSAADAGVDVIQVREKTLSVRNLSVLVRDILSAVGGTSTKVVVNERFDVALSAGAHGVHLTSTSIPGDIVRSKVPDEFLIGKSTHSIAEIQSVKSFADYVFFSPIFETPSKKGILEPKGLDELHVAVMAAGAMPVIALGGIDLANVTAVAQCGVAGIAGIGIFETADIGLTVEEIRRRFR